MGFSQEQAEAARRRQLQVARETGPRRMLREGALTLRVDAKAFHAAREQNQRDYGVDNCWAEPEFQSDMARRHPEIVVKSESGVVRVGFGGQRAERRGQRADSGGRLTRFGRVTFHKVY